MGRERGLPVASIEEVSGLELSASAQARVGIAKKPSKPAHIEDVLQRARDARLSEQTVKHVYRVLSTAIR
jgi:hypothetical protein